MGIIIKYWFIFLWDFEWNKDGVELIIFLFTIIGVTISWWKEFIGGIILIMAVIALIVFEPYRGWNVINIFIFSPFILSAIFYFLYYWQKIKYS